MSSFASRNQQVISNPFEAGVTFTIQKLSGGAVERAQAEHIRKFIGGQSPRGWEQTFRRAMASGTATENDVARALGDPLAGFDRLSVVKAGLKAWSYEQAVTDKAIEDDLDDETLEYLAIEIMRLTKPARFQTEEEAEAARKNG